MMNYHGNPRLILFSRKIIKFTSIFYKLRSILPNDCIEQIYYVLVHPHLLYGIEVYANTFNSPNRGNNIEEY